MFVRRHCTVSALIGLLLTSIGLGAEFTPEHALGYLPPSANVLSVIRVDELLSAPRARLNDWKGNDDGDEALAGTSIPAWVEGTVVIGSQVRFADRETVWTVGLLPMPTRVSMADLAAEEGTASTRFGDRTAVRSARNAYFVELRPELLGVRVPAERQETGRWLATAGRDGSALVSDYLTVAASSESQVVLAADLQNTIDPARLRAYVGSLDIDEEQVDELAQLLGSLKGITLAIDVEETIGMSVRLDFGRPIGRLDEAVRTLFFAVLADEGASLPALERGRRRTARTSLTFETELSDDSFRRLLSLIVSPRPSTPPVEVEPPVRPPTDPPRASDAPDGRRARNYFIAVDRTLNNLRPSGRQPQNLERTATWHDNGARQIDALPTTGVPEDLLDFGSATASRLRALAASLRGVAVEVNAKEQSIIYDMRVDPGYAGVSIWGGVGFRPGSWRVTSNLQQVRERQAESIAAGAKNRNEIWRMIDDDRAMVLRKMQAQFPDVFRPRRRGFSD